MATGKTNTSWLSVINYHNAVKAAVAPPPALTDGVIHTKYYQGDAIHLQKEGIKWYRC